MLTVLVAAALVVVGGVASGAQPPTGQPEPERKQPSNQAEPGNCRDGEVTTGAIFNDPHDDDAGDRKILEQLQCLIEGTPSGETIKGTTYHFADGGLLSDGGDDSGEGVVGALIAAVERDVTVEIVVDWNVGNGTGADRDYFDKFEQAAAGQDNGSFIRSCPGHHNSDSDYDRACLANRKMHNKLFTFSATHGVSNVTFLTTSNLEDDAVDHGSGNSGTDMWNSGFTAVEEAELYERFVSYLDDLAGGEENLHYHDELPDDPVGNYRIFHSPRWSGNTVLEILDKVGCSDGSTGNPTTVRVSMMEFSDTSGFGSGIADKLWELDNDGCDVDIVANALGYDESDPSNEGALRTLLKMPQGNGPEVREFDGDMRYGVHDKNLMIDGNYDGTDGQKIVFTGSFNFTRSSIGAAGDDQDGNGTPDYKVNDETWLQINDPDVHDQFVQNFEVVRNAAQICWQTSEQEGCGQGRTAVEPEGSLDCHETADEYQGAGNLYLYKGTYCDGSNDAKSTSEDDSNWGDTTGPIQNFDNEADSIVNTTNEHIEFFNYPNYNEGQPDGDSFCVRPDQWVSQVSKYGDGNNSWSNSISSHRVVDDPEQECDRWFGGYHEPNR